MKTQLRFNLSMLLILLGSTFAFAQPANNDCAGAIPIIDLDGTCSGSGTFTNVNATASGQGPTGCFTNVNHDVWFSFVAQATDLTVTINGNNASGGGTLNNPQVGLLRGNCGGTLTMFHCATDVGTGNNGIEMYGGALTLGQTYFIRVDGSNTGTFEICVNNFFAPPNPESDCVDAVILCDKSPFTVQSVAGAGNNTNEFTNNCGLSETNSSWYKWTCDQAGTLEFTLTPTNQADDLDFVVYQLANGQCSQKSVIRCMAAGDFVFPSVCMGPTGLGNGATDLTEASGCGQGQDSWLAPLQMAAGDVYILAVNNYTSSGNGFQISFGGTGTFVGPTADFTNNDADNTICVGDNIVFSDQSVFPNGSDGYVWNFGVGAAPLVGGGTGPHTVSYTSPGVKSIALTVESTLGCVVSTVRTIQVNACCDTENPITAGFNAIDATCPGTAQGSFTVSGNTGFPPFTYQWNNPNLIGAMGNNLYAGVYSVTMTDEIGCDTVLNIPIGEPSPFSIVPTIVRPTCGGGTNGSVTLAVSGATPGYQYDWGSGFTNSNLLTGLGNGIYPVTVRDAAGCDTMVNIPVLELTLELDTLADFVIEPTCFGFTNGSITISMANGQSPYQFDWNDGNGFVTNNSLSNIGSSTYTLNVVDANGCVGGPFQIDVIEPDSLIATGTEIRVGCYGDDDGEAIAIATGGNGGYNFQWNNGITDSLNLDLEAGLYGLTVTDLKGCTDTTTVEVTEPDPFEISGIDVVDAFCYADSNGSLTVQVSGGTQPFQYSLNGVDFQVSNTFDKLRAGIYTAYVQDAFGCEYTRTATVSQPWIFYVDAGEDQTIELGYEAEIDALVNTLTNTTYQWSPPDGLSCTDCEDPVAAPVQTTTYLVEVVDGKGCPAEDSITINVEILRPYFIPNAFTPNLDGENDYFYVYGGPAILQVRTLKVFDRWGGHVFEANNIPANQGKLGWDGNYRGKAVMPGVFVFYIEIEFLDGHVEVVKGDVTVLK